MDVILNMVYRKKISMFIMRSFQQDTCENPA